MLADWLRVQYFDLFYKAASSICRWIVNSERYVSKVRIVLVISIRYSHGMG